MVDDVDEVTPSHASQVGVCNSKNDKSKVDIERENWSDSWFSLFDWIEFNHEEGRVFSKVSKKYGGRNVFAKVAFVNIKVCAFKDHGKSDEHRNFVSVEQKGKKTMEKMIVASNKACDEAILFLFKGAYFLCE